MPARQLSRGAEKERLTKELQKVELEIQKVEAKLANPNFSGKAPPDVLTEHRQRLPIGRPNSSGNVILLVQLRIATGR